MYVHLFFCTVLPRIITQPLTQIVKSSSNVTFLCVASAKPRAKIQWINRGTILTNSSKILIANKTKGSCLITDPIDQCETTSILEIFNTQPPDNGNYTCNATNEVGYVEKSATLSIDGTYICMQYITYVCLQLHTHKIAISQYQC